MKAAQRVKKDSYNLKADFDYLEENNYHVIKQIGRGSYGVVYKAEDKNTGGHCAIKINFNIISREQLYIEMGLLRLMRDKNHVPFLHRIIEKKSTYSIIMDYHRSHPFITFFTRFTMTEIKHYLYELLLGLKELKELGIYHRDIKPSNFLYNEGTKRGIIVDFGLAEIDDSHVKKLKEEIEDYDLTNGCEEELQEMKDSLDIYENIQGCLITVGRNKIGTEIFMPPESVLRQQNQTYSSDMWPVGIILLQFCTHRFNIFSNNPRLQEYFKLGRNSFLVSYFLQLSSLFGKQRVIDTCRECFGHALVLPNLLREVPYRQLFVLEVDHSTEDLLDKLLTLDPKDRITVEEALEHQFFDEIRDQHNEQNEPNENNQPNEMNGQNEKNGENQQIEINELNEISDINDINEIKEQSEPGIG